MKKNLLKGLLLSLMSLLAFAPLALADDVRVLLSDNVKEQFSITIDNGDYDLLFDYDGEEIDRLSDDDQIILEESRNGYDLYVNDRLLEADLDEIYLLARDENCLFSYEDKLYRGDFRFNLDDDAYAVNIVDVEYYLYGVVGKEIGYNQPLEATKAQAVASRSYVMAKLNPNHSYYDVTDGTSSQVYGGYSAEIEGDGGIVIEAIDATWGEVVYYKDDIFDCVYHSNAGGHTEDAANVWGGSSPLQGVESPYDSYAEESGYSNNIYSWQKEFTPSEIVDLAERYAGRSIGDYVGISLSTIGADGQPTVSGRVTEFTVTGSDGVITVTDSSIRSMLDNLRSNLFTVNQNGSNMNDGAVYVLDAGSDEPILFEDSDDLYAIGDVGEAAVSLADSFHIADSNSATAYGSLGSDDNSIITIEGFGYGHGVGMSQWGAIGMAEDGYDYQEILAHYYNMDINEDFYLGNYE